ncbi:ATP-dependent endonuclease [Aeromonas sp. sia0103]|uniref:ATP-dependent nuclease n=1 Tax=Aeromonas sp. sia0103 TaxID=2854782 RepID=UPI001C4897A1|nr:AAA family ATPase [Aeromonas sp. sia0103]MBV7600080.1 ATP-binding protein [Aeromonas sp. sia0103]
MEFIKSIKIRKFRSIKSLTRDLTPTHLNIFVGKNDQGKSNLLRALNLFFNGETDVGNKFRFDDDYCYHSNKGKGTKIEIRIDLEIHPPKSRFKNSDPVHWVKIWKRDGSISEDKINLTTGEKLQPKDNVYKWLDKIRYRYVPAIKGQEYFSILMGELHDVLNETHADILAKQGDDFIKGIQGVTQAITTELDSQLGIKNSIQVPSDFRQLFSNLDFGTRIDNNTYHLKQRGDGVKVRHIPIILKYMSEKEKSISIPGYVKPDTIWGFEEPENNLELKFAFDLAKTIKEYSKDIQIFITTHSPAFYALDVDDSDGVNTYFISQTSDNCTSVKHIEHSRADELHEHMGLLPLITPYLSKIYAHQEEISHLKSEMDNLQDKTKFIVLTEDQDFEHVKSFFSAHNCDLEATEFIPYLGADQINSAIMLGKYLKDKKDDMTIIIHRDRDYHTDETIERIKTKIEQAKLFFYVTDGVDLEGQYICPLHINELYPDISVDDITRLIEEATVESTESSIDRLIDQTLKTCKPENQGYAKKIREINAIYQSNISRYRYGKKVSGVLKAKLQKILKRNVDIFRPTPHIINEDLQQVFLVK